MLIKDIIIKRVKMKIIISLLMVLGIVSGFILAILLVPIKLSIGHILPFIKATVSIQAISMIFIMWIIIILRRKWFNAYLLLVSFLVYITILIGTINYEIARIALKKFNIVPEYIDINFDIFSERKTPHAIVEKNGKVFYWSFRRNDFIFYFDRGAPNSKSCDKECIDNLINDIFQTKGE